MHSTRWRTLLLLTVTALAFAPGLGGDWVWDDTDLILHNGYIQRPDVLSRAFTTSFWDVSSLRAEGVAGYWRPLVTLAYAAQWRAFGASPRGWHLVSLALHLACVALAARWIARRLGGAAPEAALFGAALFALHPTRPETVSWVSGCTDLWAALFTLLALEAWDRQTRRGLALGAVSLALAVMAKESALLIPAALALDAGLSRGALPDRATLRRLAALSAPMLALTALRLRWVPLLRPTTATTAPLDAPLRVLSSLGHAARMALAPVPASSFAAPATLDAAGAPTYATWSVLVGAAVLGVAALALHRARRDPRWRPWVADGAWLLVVAAPALNVVPLRLEVLVAPRFLYLPLLGLAAMAARLAASVPAARARTTRLVAGALLATCFGLTLERAAQFTSDDALFTHEQETHPEVCATWRQLAAVRSAAGRRDEALQLERGRFACALREGRDVAIAAAGHTLAERVADVTPDAEQRTLGAVLAFLRAFDPAREGPASLDVPPARIATPLTPRARAAVWPSMQPFVAVVEARTLDLPAAESRLRAALARDDRSLPAWRNLLVVLAQQERWPEVLAACATTLARAPNDGPLRGLCGLAQAAWHDTHPPPADPYAARLAVARRRLALGARELARRDAAALFAERNDRPEALLLLARADLADGLRDRARARLIAGLTGLPEAAQGPVRALLQEIDTR
jgi:hypothetical protein